jgi:hypothetical protein
MPGVHYSRLLESFGRPASTGSSHLGQLIQRHESAVGGTAGIVPAEVLVTRRIVASLTGAFAGPASFVTAAVGQKGESRPTPAGRSPFVAAARRSKTGHLPKGRKLVRCKWRSVLFRRANMSAQSLLFFVTGSSDASFCAGLTRCRSIRWTSAAKVGKDGRGGGRTY